MRFYHGAKKLKIKFKAINSNTKMNVNFRKNI